MVESGAVGEYRRNNALKKSHWESARHHKKRGRGKKRWLLTQWLETSLKES